MIGLGSALALGASGMGISAGVNRGESTLDSLTNYYFGGKAEKRSNERSKSMSMFDHALDWEYYKKASALGQDLYAWQSAFDYDYARRYAENSAKWQTTGLRNAGLNPILAATDGNFRGTFGQHPSGIDNSFSSGSGSASSGSSFGSARTSGQHIDLPEVMRDLSSAELSNVNAKTAEGMMEPTINSAKADVKLKEATAEYQRAQALNVDANTAKVISETVDLQNGGKVSGWANLVGRVMSVLPDRTRESVARQLSDVKSLRALTTPTVEGSSSSANRDGKTDLPIESSTRGNKPIDIGHKKRYNSIFTH